MSSTSGVNPVLILVDIGRPPPVIPQSSKLPNCSLFQPAAGRTLCKPSTRLRTDTAIGYPHPPELAVDGHRFEATLLYLGKKRPSASPRPRSSPAPKTSPIKAPFVSAITDMSGKPTAECVPGRLLALTWRSTHAIQPHRYCLYVQPLQPFHTHTSGSHCARDKDCESEALTMRS